MHDSSLDFLRLADVSQELGACISNLRLDYGELGRGLFCSSDQFVCRIPSSLFFPINCVSLSGSGLAFDTGAWLSWNNELSNIEYIADFIAEYLNIFVLNPAEQQKWHLLWALLNDKSCEQLKELMTSLAIYPFPEEFSFQMDEDFSLYLYLKSRSFHYNGEICSAPIWDLINHSPDAYNFRISPASISSPSSCTLGPGFELLQRYSPTISGVGMWLTHLFASREYFVYSFRCTIRIPALSLTLAISGLQNLDQVAPQVGDYSDYLILRAFPIVSPSFEFSLKYLAQYLPPNFPLISLTQIYKHILQYNIEQRRKLLSLCTSVPHASLNSLSRVIRDELLVIESRLHDFSSLK